MEEQEETKEEDISIIDKGEEIAKRIEEGNKKAAELIERQERALAGMRLQGKSYAGKPQEVEVELSNEEYKKKIEKEISEGKYL
jgi:hypothetical protein